MEKDAGIKDFFKGWFGRKPDPILDAQDDVLSATSDLNSAAADLAEIMIQVRQNAKWSEAKSTQSMWSKWVESLNSMRGFIGNVVQSLRKNLRMAQINSEIDRLVAENLAIMKIATFEGNTWDLTEGDIGREMVDAMDKVNLAYFKLQKALMEVRDKTGQKVELWSERLEWICNNLEKLRDYMADAIEVALA